MNKIVDSEIRDLLAPISANVIKNLITYGGQGDFYKFDAQTKNADTIISLMHTDKYKVMSCRDFYDATHEYKYRELSKVAQSIFDKKNGDIIVTDMDNNPIYCIDLKISNKYMGAVNAGSLFDFRGIAKRQHIYLCANISTGDKRIFSHDALYDAVVDGVTSLHEPTNTYKGYPVHDKKLGSTLSEYFVKGLDIAKIFN